MSTIKAGDIVMYRGWDRRAYGKHCIVTRMTRDGRTGYCKLPGGKQEYYFWMGGGTEKVHTRMDYMLEEIENEG